MHCDPRDGAAYTRFSESHKDSTTQMITRQLTKGQAAELLGVGYRTLSRWIGAGILPVVAYPGRGKKFVVRIDEGDLKRFIQKHRAGRCASISSLPNVSPTKHRGGFRHVASAPFFPEKRHAEGITSG